MSHFEPSPNPEILWHYTTLDSLEKIVENKTLRASYPTSMNDATEIRGNFDRLRSLLREDDRFSSEKFVNDDQFWSRLRSLKMPYLACLSNAKDSLSMWRGYGGAVTSTEGVAIGFDFENLVAILKTQSPEFGSPPLPVEYDDTPMLSILDQFASEHGRGNLTKDDRFVSYVINYVILRKHDGFKEEREWRVACLPEDSGSGEPQAKTKDIDLGSKIANERYICGISELMAGPKTEKERLLRFRDQLAKDLCRPQVTKSVLPFK